MSAIENPYAPPESASAGLRMDGNALSYWIKDDLLFVAHGAVLPDVCLETGHVEGEMVRVRHLLKPMPKHAYLYLALGLMVGVGLLKLLIVPWIAIAGLFGFLFFRPVIEANLCTCREARSREKSREGMRLLVAVGVVAFLILAPFDGLDRMAFGLSIGLIGQFLLRRWSSSFRVVGVSKKVAVLEKVHPEALRQLDRWRRAHLARHDPDQPGDS